MWSWQIPFKKVDWSKYQRFKAPFVPSKVGVWGGPGEAAKPFPFRVNVLPSRRKAGTKSLAASAA
jgi:hypothetical protein